MSLFAEHGAHVLVDAQFGSTGKGLFAAWLAEKAMGRRLFFDGVISNAGPNSGHTFYNGNTKVVLKQLPSFAVRAYQLGCIIPTYLSAGAIIDPQQLRVEALAYPNLRIFVSPVAAVIGDDDRETERNGTVAAVAGTRSGTGAALARKVLRDPNAVWGIEGHIAHRMPDNVKTLATDANFINLHMRRVFVEVSQGFSLGLNDPRFFPKVTSRECTVAQAISDARIAPKFVTKTYAVARTFPIRVGNVDGFSSGGHYPDQQEIDWKDIGVEPELTTVTKRPRRIFTLSLQQLRDAFIVNQPDVVLLNFMNYLSTEEQHIMSVNVNHLLHGIGLGDTEMYYGYGPLSSDIMPF